MKADILNLIYLKCQKFLTLIPDVLYYKCQKYLTFIKEVEYEKVLVWHCNLFSIDCSCRQTTNLKEAYL